jgi:two-component system, cell cycle sensor histidine kinase and response regulator CckA
MPRGGKLTIETTNIDLDDDCARSHLSARSGSHVLLAVSDTGHGMTEEVKTRIFEPFFTTKTVGQGTGLGLATVYGIVKRAEGHIDVDTEVNGGTSFKIFLPQVNISIKPGRGNAAFNRSPRGTEAVLLVEDEASVRGVLRQELLDSGYSVSAAANSNDALRIAQDHRGAIDIIVTDVVLPESGSRQMVEQLVLLHPKVKVLYLSGYTDDAIARHGISHEEVPFLQKPFSPSALARKVREVLDS